MDDLLFILIAICIVGFTLALSIIWHHDNFKPKREKYTKTEIIFCVAGVLIACASLVVIMVAYRPVDKTHEQKDTVVSEPDYDSIIIDGKEYILVPVE